MALLLMAMACSVLRKESSETEIRNFLAQFHQRLSATPKDVLQLFDSKQSRDVIETAVSILQNREHEFIVCTAAMNSAEIVKTDQGVRINIPISFKSKNIDEEYTGESTLTLWLIDKGESLAISRIEADDFYKAFARIKHDMDWLVERKREISNREPFYAAAKALQQNFDSVIWYTQYLDKAFYYVVQGAWLNYARNYERDPDTLQVAMGLVDENGNVVIPVKYDLIGTIGFTQPGLVEVKARGKVGYYDVRSRREVIPPLYDVIFPYAKGNVNFIVKRDSIFGWIDRAWEYHDGFADEPSERWIKEFKFIPSELKLDAGNQALCEIPVQEHAGFGMIIPPSYLVRTGIFDEIVGGISPTPFPINGWTDFVETKGSAVETVTESVMAVITTIRERYLDGRQEFYSYNRIAFVGPKQDTLAVAKIGSSGGVKFKKTGSLLELSYEPDDEYYFENSYWPDIVPVYTYFTLTDDLHVVPAKTDRTFAQTAFVYLDSSYFQGPFKRWVTERKDSIDVMGYRQFAHLSRETLQYMHDDILASYGFKFQDEERNGYFNFNDIPARSMEEIEAMLSDVDRHNLDLLKSMISKAEPHEKIPQNI